MILKKMAAVGPFARCVFRTVFSSTPLQLGTQLSGGPLSDHAPWATLRTFAAVGSSSAIHTRTRSLGRCRT